MAGTIAERPNVLTHLRSDRRVAAMLGLGFASGIPFLLVYSTQSAWLTQAGVPIETLGLISEMTLAYKLKFVWAPLLERYDAPGLGRLLGRRRGWIVAAQLAIVIGLVGIAFGDPGHRLAWTVAFSLALGFAGATQDVMVDGWRINTAPEKQAVMASIAEIGWRIGTLAASAGPFFLSGPIGWPGAYLCMAALMVPGVIATIVAPEPEPDAARATDAGRLDLDPRTNLRALARALAALATTSRRRATTGDSADTDAAMPHEDATLVAVIVTPIRDLIARLGPMALPILVLVAGFRMPGYVSSVMAIPLFKHLHYSNSDIGTVTTVFGFIVALGGTALGGILIPRIGMMASLVVGTVAGSSSHLALAWLAWHGDHGGTEFWTFAIAVSIDAFAYAFASIVLITYMSTLVSKAMAASQYALLTSLVALPGSLLAAGSGFVIRRTGFEMFFVGTSLIGIPVALLCLWVWRRQVERPAAAAVFD